MSQNTFIERWRNYTATKATLFWACVASVIATIVIGFAWGGWVTGGTAQQMADQSARDARAQLAATVCVERFTNGPDARSRLSTFHQTSTWQRDNVLEQGGWVTMPGMAAATDGAADICAERLAAMPEPPAS